MQRALVIPTKEGPHEMYRYGICTLRSMALSETLIKKLARKFAPDEMVDLRFAGNDLTVKTDAAGNAILLFIGTRGEDGYIRGERYARRLLHDAEGKVIKDHWERKGPSR